MHGSYGRLAGGWDLRMGRSGSGKGALPAAHHVISNFKSWLAGTFHGVSVERLQEYADEFGWRYSHRRGDALSDLLGELVRWPHVSLSEIRECRVAMGPHEAPEEPGRGHNEYLRRKWHKREREEREAEEGRREAEEGQGLPDDLLSSLGQAFSQSP